MTSVEYSQENIDKSLIYFDIPINDSKSNIFKGKTGPSKSPSELKREEANFLIKEADKLDLEKSKKVDLKKSKNTETVDVEFTKDYSEFKGIVKGFVVEVNENMKTFSKALEQKDKDYNDLKKSFDELKDTPQPIKSFKNESQMAITKSFELDSFEKGEVDEAKIFSLSKSRNGLQGLMGVQLENNPTNALIQKASLQYDADWTLPPAMIKLLNTEGIKIVR